jgi:hypothetical protein
MGYLPVISLLSYFEIGEPKPRVDQQQSHDKDRCTRPSAGATLPALLALLDTPVGDATWLTLDPVSSGNECSTQSGISPAAGAPTTVCQLFECALDHAGPGLLDGVNQNNSHPATYYLSPRVPSRMGRQVVLCTDAPQRACGQYRIAGCLLVCDAALAPLGVCWSDGQPLFLGRDSRTLVETKRSRSLGDTASFDRRNSPATVQIISRARRPSRPATSTSYRSPQLSAHVVSLLRAVIDPARRGAPCRFIAYQAAEFVYGGFPDLNTASNALTQDVAYGQHAARRRRGFTLRS